MLASFILDDPNQDGPPSVDEVLAEISRHPNGIDATEVVRVFAGKGYPTSNVQRVLQIVLTTGQAELGAQLKLFAQQQVAA